MDGPGPVVEHIRENPHLPHSIIPLEATPGEESRAGSDASRVSPPIRMTAAQIDRRSADPPIANRK